ncbi:hypothetical protein ThidrDRAFT_1161 [Thiorhodococcus drewsii AZ1]|uniref:DUF4407 domain-containing protein n=1 Tax=Thiorhodococcus drewsii AZ1 TaxID=765913 RepID=G2DYP9_9GAMM|nr:DUF4407 domain-containing protein [Thiorhodococcus drewsii]EGV32676.1 hypothetical protein ThidrDRAFT_1161 [Thiorhodococcus drewsii AZ1]
MITNARVIETPCTAAGLEGRSLLERLMAVGTIERDIIAGNPKLRREIAFQALALILCSISLGYAVYRVAISLLGFPVFHALPLATLAAIGLFALDHHYLIQARGNGADDIRRAIYQVRFVSIVIIMLSFSLMTTDTFHADIERILAEAKEVRRATMEQSPQYALELGGAREAMVQATAAIGREEELQLRLRALQVELGRALQDMQDEIQGNETDGKIRVGGFGPRARGFRTTAERLGREIATTKEELGRIGDPQDRLTTAKQRLATVEQRLQNELNIAYGGRSQRLEAMGMLLKSSSSAWIAVTFWILIGTLPDLMMFAAQRRMFNHDLFEAMRAAEHEDLRAEIDRLRRMLRQRQTDRLTPIEVSLTAAPLSEASGDAAETRAHKAQGAAQNGGAT